MTNTNGNTALATAETVATSTEFVRFWNDILVPKFIRFRHILVEGLQVHSEIALKNLTLKPGAAVVDVGCGFGDTAIQLAEMVGRSGRVDAIDCCDAFLEFGRQALAVSKLKNLSFMEADAEQYRFQPEYDFCFSRFGMMFFSNPVNATRNIRKSLKPGGQFMSLVWRNVGDNPWLGMAKAIVLRHLPAPGTDAQTCGPGPFSMANQEMVTGQMKSAGFTDVKFQRLDAPVMIGRDVREAIDFQLAIGPAGEVFREAGEEGEAKREIIETDMRNALSNYLRPEGVVMPSSSWTITATNPT